MNDRSHSWYASLFVIVILVTGRAISRDLEIKPSLKLTHGKHVTAVALSPDGKTMVSGAIENGEYSIAKWSFPEGKKLWIVRAHGRMITDLSISNDGRTLASVGFDGTLKLWEMTTGKLLGKSNESLESLLSVAFFPKKKKIITQEVSSAPKFWDFNMDGALKLSELQPLYRDQSFSRIAISRDETRIAMSTGFLDRPNDIILLNSSSGKEISKLQSVRNIVNCLTFSPNDRLIAAGYLYGQAGRGTIEVWSLPGKGRGVTLPLESGVFYLAFNLNGSSLFAGDNVGKITIWDMRTHKSELSWRAHNGQICFIGFSRDGKYLLTGSHDGNIKIWSASSLATHSP